MDNSRKMFDAIKEDDIATVERMITQDEIDVNANILSVSVSILITGTVL